jgi:protein-L-isoaspartate(D-aspartate) O-methyltransferase
VVGVELEPDLAAWGGANIAAAIRSSDRPMATARIETARPGVLGWPWEAPYDRILVSAAASALPADLVGQLADDDAVMVCVVGSRLLRVRTTADGPPEVSEHGSYSFVPLRQSPLSAKQRDSAPPSRRRKGPIL